MGALRKHIHNIYNRTQVFSKNIALWKNSIRSAITAQQQYVDKTGISTKTSEVTTKIIDEVTYGIMITLDIQSQIIQTAFDASSQNAKMINYNATSFTELNRNIYNLLTNTWNTRQ